MNSLPSAPAALLASVLLSACVSDEEAPYRITIRPNGTVNAVEVYPAEVGNPTLQDPDFSYVPFTTDADKAADSAYQDQKAPQRLEPYTSVFCVTSVSPYRARFRIVDAADRIAFQGRADFGSAGELRNFNRITPKGLQGCLEWHMAETDPLYRSDLREPGIYRWQVGFSFDQAQETFVIERAFSVYRWPSTYQ